MSSSRIVQTLPLLCVLLSTATAARAQSKDESVLILSDIHFNPFDDDALIAKLAGIPATQWGTVFATDGRSAMEGRDDTNYPLLMSTIAAMQKAVPEPKLVVITGDFLAHDFRPRFDKTSAGTVVSYEDFVDKTIAFLALQLGAAFPHAQFAPVVGNNDSYCGDYMTSKNTPFLAHMAQAWAPLVNRNGATTTFRETFPGMGHYVADVPGTSLRLVIVNSVFWSRKFAPFKNECGASGEHPGADELAWLEQELAQSAGKQSWILTHIPPGMDAYSSASKDKAVISYGEAAEKGILALLEKDAERIPLFLAGHTHMGAFRVQHEDASAKDVPILVSPAISPLFGNDPAFRVATLSTSTGRITDFTEYAFQPSSTGAPAWKETYRLSDFEKGGVTPEAVVRIQHRLETDTRLRTSLEADYASDTAVRAKVEKSWRVYACAMTSTAEAPFEVCMKSLAH